MSNIKDWTGIDINPYLRIFKRNKDYFFGLVEWIKTYHKMKRGEYKVDDAKLLADILTKANTKKYYVIQLPTGVWMPINNSQFDVWKTEKYGFRENATILDLKAKCVYETNPVSPVYGFYKSEIVVFGDYLVNYTMNLPKGVKLDIGKAFDLWRNKKYHEKTN